MTSSENPQIRNSPVWLLPNIWRLGRLGVRNLAQMSLIKSHWMLQNARVTAFTVFKLLRENQQDGEGGGGRPRNNPVRIYLLKVNSRSTRTRCEICSKLTIKIPEQCQWRRSDVFMITFEHISHLVLVFLLLTLNM